MAARSIASASLSFGLVTIPVKLYSTRRRESQVSFHWLHAACGTRVNMQWYCPKDDQVVERKDLVRGYELEKGTHVEVDKDELAAAAERKRDDIGIIEFVPIATINPLLHEHGYYLAPDRHGDKAYAILSRALERSERVAIGRYAARGDDHVVAIEARDGVLVMLQLRFADEVRGSDEIPVTPARVTERELELADQLIAQHAAESFDPTVYRDEVRLRKQKLIEDKAAAGHVRAAAEVAPGAESAGPIIDLMAALKASLGATATTKSHPRATVPRHRTRRKTSKRASS